MNEKRKFDRYLLVTDVEQHKMQSKERSRGKTKNISSGGICITTEDAPLGHGELYLLRFTLPESGNFIVEVKAKVVYNRHYFSGSHNLYDNGLQFVDIKKELLEQIDEYKIGSVFEG
ncbi:MAG: PilZ domain-containing protein [Spirochaetales bacterium]|nr:PilZ domain-containing protein [Spirochaetales bacterium]